MTEQQQDLALWHARMAEGGARQQQQEQITGTNGLAIAGMVLGIIGCISFGFALIPAILAVIFGHRSLKVIKRNGQAGKSFAIAAISTGWTAVGIGIFWVLIGIVGALTSGSSAGGY
jgi:hypothetical protein